jgi:hypothetical protein
MVPIFHYCLMTEELARIPLSGAAVAMQTLIGTDLVFRFGTDAIVND